MWYVFDLNGNCVASCDFEPNHKDLDSRKEVAIESNGKFDISKIKNNNGVIEEKEESVEQSLVNIRIRRNQLLAESDWTDTLSAKGRLGLEKYNTWQTYRQALRDLPETVDLKNPQFPKIPS